MFKRYGIDKNDEKNKKNKLRSDLDLDDIDQIEKGQKKENIISDIEIKDPDERRKFRGSRIPFACFIINF